MSENKSSEKKEKLHKAHFGVIFISLIAGFVGATIAISLFMNRGDFLSNPTVETNIINRDGEVIAEVVNDLKPSVVSINTSVRANSGNIFIPSYEESAGAGTGLIINEKGLVVTNKHVVPKGTTSTSIIDSEGKVYSDVEVVDRDTVSDIAFLQIKSNDKFKSAKLGKSSDMRVGERVIAIGNALGMFSNTVTSGIISGTGRPITASDGNSAGESFENLIQTDASINPGNSGGPLVNLAGEVIAINTAVASNAENIGFAIPIDEVAPLIVSVEKDNQIIRPFIGVNFVMVNPAIAENYNLDVSEGALIVSPGNNGEAVLSNSPADKVGLREGDVITSVGKTELGDTTSLVSAVNKYSVGDNITITFNRDGKEINKQVTLEKNPN